MRRLLLAFACLSLLAPARATEQVLAGKLHHLRAGGSREWSDFLEMAEGPSLTARFQGRRNEVEGSLRIRQQDVKQAWTVMEVKVAVRVLGPGWVTAEKIELYSNGVKAREAAIPGGGRPGVKWTGLWTLPRFAHDVHLAAIATGPGIQELYWPIARPYQPSSPAVDRRVVGSTGAVWIDADGDGKRTCALDYARRLLDAAGPDGVRLAQSLSGHDEAVAIQAAGLLQARGVSVEDEKVLTAAREAGPQVEGGFRAFIAAWREIRAASTHTVR